MNEEQLIEFVNWLPTAVPEFQNASPDQIVQSLNQMAESEEGQQMLSQLFTAFQESKQAGNSQMFKKGGKMAAFVNKYGNGGCVSCKKKEILRGGMVNKMAEKMQDGNKMPTKSINSVLFPSMNYDYSNLTKPFDENGNIVDTTQSNNPNIFQRLKNWWQRNTQPTIITEPARSPEQIDSLLNVPRPSFFGSPRRKQTTSVLTAQNGGELATMTSAETANNIGLIPMAQKGNQMPSNNPNQIAENTVLSILSSPRPFVQQNITPTETREFYAYDRNRLPDNVGGPFNFEGAIRTITPSDTTITYQIPNQGIYGVASSKNRGSNWGFINSSMDKIKDKANKQNK